MSTIKHCARCGDVPHVATYAPTVAAKTYHASGFKPVWKCLNCEATQPRRKRVSARQKRARALVEELGK